jgi:hypothetical protein
VRLNVRRLLLIAVAVLRFASSAAAQTVPSGDVTVAADYLPNRNDTVELRARVFAQQVLDPTPRLLITLSGFAEGLAARRGVNRFPAGDAPPPFPAAGHANVDAAILRVQEASVKYTRERFDLLAGVSRVAWGKLDELQPTDVVNPLDISRFFFEGRSEARLPVALLRARAFLSENASIEGLYVPFHRRGRFDQLAEPTSPFNLETSFATDSVACLAIGCPSVLPARIERREPAATFGNAQGGARFSATSGRLDWSVTAYRGFEPFGFGTFVAPSPQAGVAAIEIVYPRFTMIGGDFETVRGPWGLRGEIAAFVGDNFQTGPSRGFCAPACEDGAPRVVAGTSIDAGFGVDRRAGGYRISGSLLGHREAYDGPVDRGRGPRRARSDVSLILSADRSFAAERYQIRTFGVYNATESSAFLRGIATAKLRDNVSLEGSAGWFAGDGGNLTGAFSDCDFGYVRLKYYF